MTNDLLDFMGFIILPAVFIIGGIGLAGNEYGKYVCRNYEQITKLETKWVTLDTCYINTPGGWLRYDEYKARAYTNEKGTQ